MENNTSKPRFFFALDFSDSLKQNIYEYSTKIRISDDNPKLCKIIPYQNYHITLLFLGHISINYISGLVKNIKNIKVRKFELNFNKLGYFKQSHVVWLGCNSVPQEIIYLNQQLYLSCQEYLEDCMSHSADKAHIHLSDRFNLHVSLLKKVQDQNYILNYSDINSILNSQSDLKYAVNKFALMESVNSTHGVQYKVIEEFQLV